MTLRAALLLYAATTSLAAPGCSLIQSDTVLTLSSPFTQLTFDLLRGAVDAVRGRFLGDGDFSTSPNLAGAVGAAEGKRRGAVAVTISPGGGAADISTADVTRLAPLAYTVLRNDTDGAGFAVTLSDASNALTVTLTFYATSDSRAVVVNASAVCAKSISPVLVSLSTLWSAPSATGWYAKGVRQGMKQSNGLLGSPSPLLRANVMGDGATGAVEVLPLTAPTGSSWLFAANGEYGTRGGIGVAMWGAALPADSWVGAWDGAKTPVVRGAASPTVSLSLFPNDRSFPPSEVPPVLPAGVDVDDITAILQGVHGAVVTPLHSYDFFPEVRAAPCLTYQDGNCYGGDFSFYDPDSGISNSALLYTFDNMLQEQVRGQLETNMARVCSDDSTPDRCVTGQCIHHFVGDCNGGGAECQCVDNPNGQRDCVVYDSIAGGVQTGPNIFTTLAALRYAGTTGNGTWLSANMPLLRSMINFLEPLYDSAIGLYSVPGSLQIDVFIRANYTSDSNAMFIILFELFADAEAFVGNVTGSTVCLARADALRAGMNKYLLSADGSHYCTQSDPAPGGGVTVCARDFIDYDANAIAVAAKVPVDAAAANRILARLDAGNCTHAGRATYVSEVLYDKANCVGGNTGDSAVTMGRIAWQDALARQSVGDAAAAATFADVLLKPLQADLLRRTWLPERYKCDGTDTHNQYYFEYPAVVALMLYEVKYGISLQMTKVVVNPLGAPAAGLTFALGGLEINYSSSRFHAQLPLAHSGTRDFFVHGLAPGTAWTVTPSGGAPQPATVGADGILSFTAAVGGGAFVDAVKN